MSKKVKCKWCDKLTDAANLKECIHCWHIRTTLTSTTKNVANKIYTYVYKQKLNKLSGYYTAFVIGLLSGYFWCWTIFK